MWQRLEVGVLTHGLRTALEARIADPLFMLARQWQLAELRGEDAASPVLAQARIGTAPLRFWRPGRLPKEAGQVAGATALRPGPLEPIIEAEPVTDGPAALRHAAEAGMQALRALGAIGRPRRRKAICDEFPFVLPAPEALDPTARRDLEPFVGRVPDGAALRRRVKADGAPGVLLELRLPANLRAALLRWNAWYDTRFVEPALAATAWIPERMEYAFALGASNAEGEVVLEAAEYPGGELDWPAFDVAPGHALGAAGDGETIEDEVLVGPVSFGGMPNQRFWEVEDGRVDVSAIDAGPTDVARLVLAEFALIYGNDWFMVPLEIPVGRLARVEALVVTDDFGGRTWIRPSNEVDGDASRWCWLSLAGDPAIGAGRPPWLLLTPTLGQSAHGMPIEEVALVRDEVANLAWGVERLIEGAHGAPIDRFQEWLRGRGEDPPQADPLRYTLLSEVPVHWYPFVPVPVANGRSMRLRRGRIVTEVGVGAPVPQGRILVPERRLLVHEEEVERGGVTIQRAWQEARDERGRTLRWVGRRKRPGQPERQLGSRFDFLR
jgi:hypothetical protein